MLINSLHANAFDPADPMILGELCNMPSLNSACHLNDFQLVNFKSSWTESHLDGCGVAAIFRRHGSSID